MPKAKLTLSKIETARRPGMLNDGGGLYLSVTATGSMSWCFRFTLGGRRRTMGLGGIAKLNLAEARERARQCRALVEQGIDPIDYRRGDRMLSAAKTAMTFREAALAYIDAHKDGWSAATAKKWPEQFELYVFPEIGALPMPAVNDTAVVLRVALPSATGGERWGSAASIRSICARHASAPANAASWSSKASTRSTTAEAGAHAPRRRWR